MGELAEMGSVLKQTLKNLCCSNGWSYGVFWRFDSRNSMLLTMEEAYYEEQFEPLVNSMLLKSHILGEGIIGQAAFTGKHQWIFSDSLVNAWDSTGNQNIARDKLEFESQFSSGIKTIALISVGTLGVVQFGSTQKILERMEFLNETRKLFYALESYHGLMPLHSEACNVDGYLASLALSGNFFNENLTTEQGCCSREPKGTSSFMCGIQEQRINSVPQTLSHLRNQVLQKSSSVAQIISSGKISPVDCLAADTPCTSTWSSEGSILTSFDASLPSERGMWDSQNVNPKKANGLVLGGSTEQYIQDGSTFTSSYSTGELIDAELPIVDSFVEMADNQHSLGSNGGLLDSVISLQRIPEEFNPADFTNLCNSFTLDDLCQWFAPSPQPNLNGAGVASVSSTLVGGDTVIDIPARETANSLQSSITDAFVSNVENSTIVHDNGNDLFGGAGLDFRFGKTGECLEDIIMPLLHGDSPALSSGLSKSISELDVNSMAGKRKGLFSELGLEELLDGVSRSSNATKSSVEDQISTTKRMKLESSSSNFHQGQFVGLSCSSGGMNLVQHLHDWGKSDNTISNKEVLQKSQVGLWIDDSYSANAGHPVAATSKKPPRKRAKPGESTRPRPKDRQLIQDRLKELRGIVPHRGKLSIDDLLDRTIKYLLFMQGVTKYADKIKQADEPKLIGSEDGSLLKHNNMIGGATWAYEVGAQTIPIVVKDLNPPGLLLIEMLCEDQGFFLEIADAIRGLGLTILKGVMELQEDKIWARFMVEAKEQVERKAIIWSLVLLLQQSGTVGTDSVNQSGKAVDDRIYQSNNYQQPLLIPPVSMAETLQ